MNNQIYSISSIEEFITVVEENRAVLAYFSTETCAVCKVLKPKVEQMLLESFPQITAVSIQSEQLPELAAQFHIFTAPTIIVFFEGRETIRKSRAFGLYELRAEILRPYSLLFE